MPDINAVLDSLYAARVRGDLDGTMRDISDDGVFALNGQEVAGHANIKAAVSELIGEWKIEDWRQLDRTVDGSTIKLRWRAKVTNRKTGKSHTFEVTDVVTFRGGKIAAYHQVADGRQMAALSLSS
jgi:ketosteroid isomerase-like protein